MKVHYLKIREKFINQVRSGMKKHEYRLSTPERQSIKIGDTLVLFSNQNRFDFVRVTVTSYEHFETWEQALNKYWEKDFHNLFNTIEDAAKECYKFYSRDEVKQYGIIVFEIKPLSLDYKKANILLDTNVIIRREGENNVSFEIAALFKWFDKLKIQKYIHTLSKIEISKYFNDNSKNNIFKKLGAYDTLPTFNNNSDSYFESVISKYSKDENGRVDNCLLLEVYNDNVDLLLTDDQLILKKAEELYIRDKVLSSAELMIIYEDLYPNHIEYKMLSVKLKKFSDINLQSPFFDTLREDYEGVKFDKWFKKKADEKAYVFELADELKGFLYLKVEMPDEKYPDINPPMTSKKRLKVGTFKILSTGFRLGERFIKIIMDNAVKYQVEEIYVTLFENKRTEVIALKDLMIKWGFSQYGYKENGELVLVKEMVNYNISKDNKYNYPLLNSPISYFILPIFPEYHTDLFPDNILKNENIHLYEENKAHRYAIEKIYISGAKNINAKPGDLLLIYRTGERMPKRYSSVITGLAILEEVIYTQDVDDCIKICKNRSIFSEEEIRDFYPKYSVVIKLLDYSSFKNKIILNELYNRKIVPVDSGPRPFTQITKEQFNDIFELGMKEN